MLHKATRALTEEDKKMMDTEITGKNGDKRRIEQILGRQKLKKGFQYEVKFKGMDHRVGRTWGNRACADHWLIDPVSFFSAQRLAPSRGFDQVRIPKDARTV
jgi:hypothetical protein